MTNLLDSVLTDPQYYLWSDSKISGPSKVDGGLSEAFSFKGHSSYCFVLCSFAISKNLRLVILCFSSSDVGNRFGLGFAPADVSTDQTLEGILYKIPTGPDAFFLTEWSKVPIKHFMTHGNLLMKGSPRPTNNAETNSKLVRIIERFSCNIEIVNCLSVPLRNRNRWYSNSENNTFLSMEVLPLHREMFFASDQTNLKVMISYEIISTDLNLVIGLKLGPGGKSFAAAFVRFPVVTGKKKLEKLMDENQWKIHDYKTISKPSEGMQLIAIRNIRAEICMTDEERSVLKIRVFAV
ncbi:unnamed protein product [Allacma fusca]|uniref:Uncharacterized protein n=1 Tax=Allacma fusca TaxID=39272 RepID=A0A8J2P6J9_9HEXA|nr:unnamed protein product [Allacma fusca]